MQKEPQIGFDYHHIHGITFAWDKLIYLGDNRWMKHMRNSIHIDHDISLTNFVKKILKGGMK